MFAAGFKTQIGCFTLFLFVTSLGYAQDRGTIRGAITDTSSALVPGASVTATHEGTGVTRTGVTNANGQYSDRKSVV